MIVVVSVFTNPSYFELLLHLFLGNSAFLRMFLVQMRSSDLLHELLHFFSNVTSSQFSKDTSVKV